MIRRFSLALALFSLSLWLGAMPAARPRVQLPAPRVDGGQIAGSPLAPAWVAVVDFTRAARDEAARAQSTMFAPLAGIVPPNHTVDEPSSPAGEALTFGARDAVEPPDVPSPSPAASFQGLDDIAIVGSGSFIIPPDTMGAVGPTRVFTTLNNNYRILDKTDGSVISTLSMNGFWSATGVTSAFDPRTLYDPYQNRFIVAAVAQAASTSSSLLIGVSATSDPAGAWILARYQLGATTCGGVSCWADFPTLGFNQTWIAVAVNMFSNSGFYLESRVNVFDYATLRGGAAPADNAFVTGDFTVYPVQTYSATEPVLYAPVHLSSAGASYRLNTITGTAAAPIYTQGALKTHSLIGSWRQPGSPGLPQAANPNGGATQTIDPGDARIGNAVFRNGAIWYAQTVGLPAGSTTTHTAAQWIKLDTNGDDLDAGRVEDATATSTNGGKWYAYPSIAVNAAGDVLLGFSEFSSTQFPSAAYAYRAGTDAPGTMRTPVVAKAGLGYYYKTYSGTRNRWGDYSAAQVDPVDDTALWTLQEYSNPQVGTTSFWSTWWVKVNPPGTTPDPQMSLDTPSSWATLTQPFTLAGWALDRGGSSGTGVDAVHVWAYPAAGASSTGGTSSPSAPPDAAVRGGPLPRSAPAGRAFGAAGPQFVGAADYGGVRGDVAAVFGARFAGTGFSLTVTGLAPGNYTLVVSAHSTVADSFNQSRTAAITIAAPASDPAMAFDAPANEATVPPSFTIVGWAVDRAAASGTGVDAVHVYAFPRTDTGFGAGILLGGAVLGGARPDVGAVFGAQFNSAGYSLRVSGLAVGRYRVIAYARSTVAGSFNQSQFKDLTVGASPAMALDAPAPGTRGQPLQFWGWAVDLAASAGIGVDAIHVWAFPTGGGPPVFAGAAVLGVRRDDVAAVFGAQFADCGYSLGVAGLTPGQEYAIGVYARSSVTGTFNQVRFVTVTIQ